ncbi:MAG: DUF1343 domain-containing protein [Deltaproteobacteria bacterium]|nr:DUF1343 domain-containing protein [Deltaproteobacteria bacterium]
MALLAHPASVDRSFNHALDLLVAASIRVELAMGPEHGFTGFAQDMETVENEGSGRAHLSLYGSSAESLRPPLEALRGIDDVVVDLQDVGARYYTFAASMVYVMEAAAQVGARVIVLDRPNPIGGRGRDLEGPVLDDRYRSFVGELDVPVRHGLTMGELAQLALRKRRLDVDLDVVPMTGWNRDAIYDEGLPWVPPSPNMPTVDTALVYPGQCLFEGTTWSEGRGTTRPFEWVGAPGVDGRRWRDAASDLVGEGIALRPLAFKPMHQKHAGRICGGVALHVVDRQRFRPVRASSALLWAAKRVFEDLFAWRTEPYEFVSDRLAIDLLYGTDKVRRAIESSDDFAEVVQTIERGMSEFREERRACLLYPDQ